MISLSLAPPHSLFLYYPYENFLRYYIHPDTLNSVLYFQILNEISQHKIQIYEFPDEESEEDSKMNKTLKERVPFAVVGSNTVIEIDGKKVRGRKYPWGVAEGL